MLTISILLYVLFSIAIGIYASKKVTSANDYMLAGKSLPMSLATTALFATWFGSETIMGAGAAFAGSGLQGVVEDPFGAFLALFLVGVVFAKHIYRLNIITLSDLFKNRYGEGIEIISAIMMLLSLLGWIAGQFLGLGILVHVILGFDLTLSIVVCAIIVTIYTVFGGMWSVALVDFIQTIVIVLGLVLFTIQLHVDVAPISAMIDSAPEGWFQFFPNSTLQDWLIFIAALITIGFGAIPSQDIFQRVLSSKNEKVAMRSSVIGAFMYLIIGLFPLIIALYARHFLNQESYGGDTQLLLPNLVLHYASPFVKIIFMGALISAILSTASGVILASATVISENIVKPLRPTITDKQFLQSLRLSVVLVAIVALYMALSNGNIFALVAEASSFGLVSLFVPMVAAIWFKRSTLWGAILSMALGLAAYFLFDSEGSFVPIQLTGLGWSIIGIIVGSWAQWKFAKEKM